MTVRTDPYTFVNGTVANALEVNARFDQLYDLQNSNIDSTNMSLSSSFAWTGAHSWTVTNTTTNALSVTCNSLTTGSAVSITSNSSDTGTRNVVSIVNDNTLATGATALRVQQDSTGDAIRTVGGTVSLHTLTTFRIYSDAGTTLKFAVDGATGSFGIPSGQKFYLDGTALTGNTYITESSADVFQIVVAGSGEFNINTTRAEFGGDIYIGATNKIYLDGGSNTYIFEESADDVGFYAGASSALKVSATRTYPRGDVWLDATKKLYFDGGGDTYLYESSANNIRGYVGGNHIFSWNSSQVYLQSAADLLISSGKKLHFDAGGDTYDIESSANTLDRYAGGSLILRCTASTMAATASSTISFTVNSDTSITLGPTYITIDGDVMSLGVPFLTINADSSTASNQHVVKITGSNSGAGFAAGVDLTDVGTNLDYAFEVAADGTALGAYSGRIPIRVGANTRYIPYYQ